MYIRQQITAIHRVYLQFLRHRRSYIIRRLLWDTRASDVPAKVVCSFMWMLNCIKQPLNLTQKACPKLVHRRRMEILRLKARRVAKGKMPREMRRERMLWALSSDSRSNVCALLRSPAAARSISIIRGSGVTRLVRGWEGPGLLQRDLKMVFSGLPLTRRCRGDTRDRLREAEDRPSANASVPTNSRTSG
jgi:hypothetical protein